MLATELLCESWFGWAESDTPCCILNAVVLATKFLHETQSVRMGRVRHTPNRVLKEVVLATKILCETWFRSDGQSQIHTQPCLEGSRVGEKTLIQDLVRMGRVRYTPSHVLKSC